MQTSEIKPSISAPLWRRFAAIAYDMFPVLAISMLYGALVTGGAVLIHGTGEMDYTPMNGELFILFGWIISILSFYCYFWTKAGQTVGMRAWKLKVVQQNGDNIDFIHSIKRVLLAPFALFLCGIGYWWSFIDKNRDCLHDKLSNTRVIVTPKQ